MADETFETLPSPAARLTCNPPVSGNDGGHDCNPTWLAARGAVLLGRVEAIDGRRVELGPGLEESLAAGQNFVRSFRQRVDDHVAARGLDAADPEPEPPSEPVPVVRRIDLDGEGVGTILWANGFRPDHSWRDDCATDDQGWPVQTRGITPVPGLFFVGLHWLHKRKSSLFLGVGEDADHVAESIATRQIASR